MGNIKDYDYVGSNSKCKGFGGGLEPRKAIQKGNSLKTDPKVYKPFSQTNCSAETNTQQAPVTSGACYSQSQRVIH